VARLQGQELGIKSPLILRAGITFPGWAGMNRENDPGAIADNQFFYAQNVRIYGNEIVSRGGQEKIHDAAMDGCVLGFFSLPDSTTNLWLNGSLYIYNPELDPTTQLTGVIPLQTVSVASDTVPRFGMAKFDGMLLSFDAGVLYQVVIPERSSATFLSQLKAEKIVEVTEFSSYAVREEIRADGDPGPVLYIGSVTTGDVYRWDASSLSVEPTGLPTTRQILVTFLDDIWAIAGDEISKRNGGVWGSPISLPDASFVPTGAAALGNELVIVGFNVDGGEIYIFNGSSVTATHEPTTGIGGSNLVSSVTVWNGSAHYLWSQDVPGGTCEVGFYDGSTFTDTAFSFDVGEGGAIGDLEEVGPKLYVSFTSSGMAPPGGVGVINVDSTQDTIVTNNVHFPEVVAF